MQKSGFAFDNLLVLAATVALLLTKKIPAPFIVLAVLAAGILF
jgi:chromate transporter